MGVVLLELILPTLPSREEMSRHSELSQVSQRWSCHNLYRGAALAVFGKYTLWVKGEEIKTCLGF